MGRGVGFGEIALMQNEKRTATIRANENCLTYVLDGAIFKTIVALSSIDKRVTQQGFLNNI